MSKEEKAKPEKSSKLLLEQPLGTLELADSVVRTIVHQETTPVDGVMGVGGYTTEEGAKRLRRGSSLSGVKMERGPGEIALSLSVFVKYGVNIPGLAARVRERLSEAVLEMTGYQLRVANIIVDKVVMPPKPAETQPEEPDSDAADEKPKKTGRGSPAKTK